MVMENNVKTFDKFCKIAVRSTTFVFMPVSIRMSERTNACVMNLRRSLFLFFFIGLFGGCASSDDEGIQVFSATFRFSESQNAWSGAFADYKVSDSLASELYFGYENLPSNLATNQKSLMLSGKNVGENLKMFIKKKITGLSPNSEYTLVYDIIFASDAQVGVASGDSVQLIAAAFTHEPIVKEVDGYYRLTLANSGYNQNDLLQIGTIGNTSSQGYDFVTAGNTTSAYPYILGRTNSNGEIWLYVGTNSYYKDLTTIYFSYINVVFSRSN
jgi:hypothetical protein